jgi:hypothetical protein
MDVPFAAYNVLEDGVDLAEGGITLMEAPVSMR